MKKYLALLLVIVFASVLFINFQSNGKYKYVGSKKCVVCHKLAKYGNQAEKWGMEKHSKAYETLASDKSKEVAKKAGVKGDPQKAKECLECHTTAGTKDKALVDASYKVDMGVGCEACHGPGSVYKKMSNMKDTEKFLANGGRKDFELCKDCHNEKSPTFVELKDFKEAFKKIAHPVPEK